MTSANAGSQRNSNAPNPEAAIVAVKDLETGLSGFATVLSSCQTELDNDHRAVTALRSRIFSDAALYTNVHLTGSKTFLTQLQDSMGNYVELDFEDFLDDIVNIANESAKYAEQAQLVADLHTQMQVVTFICRMNVFAGKIESSLMILSPGSYVS